MTVKRKKTQKKRDGYLTLFPLFLSGFFAVFVLFFCTATHIKFDKRFATQSHFILSVA